jgi:hypothetical protein
MGVGASYFDVSRPGCQSVASAGDGVGMPNPKMVGRKNFGPEFFPKVKNTRENCYETTSILP